MDGDYYFAKYNGKLVTNTTMYAWATNCDKPKDTYTFGPDGKMVGTNPNGEIIEIDGVRRYYESGKPAEKYLVCVDGDYYFTQYNGKLVTNTTMYAWATNCDMPKGTYTFGPDGKMIGSDSDGEIVELDGVLYYYENGEGVEKGLVEVDGDYYFAFYKGKLAVDTIQYAFLTNCDLPKDNYEFGADGKMLNGIIEKDGVLYYYENGKGVEKGLIEFDGSYYFARFGGKLAVNETLYAHASNCDMPKGNYEFGANGKMLNGVVEKGGALYYYDYGKTVGEGLFYYEGAYYFAFYNGKLAVNMTQYAYKTKCDLPKGNYEFGADGKVLNGIIEKDGVLYYYENGQGVEKGLVYLDGYYYFAQYKGKLVTNQKKFYVYEANGLLLESEYDFNELGQITG